jgi:hypothetical protein
LPSPGRLVGGDPKEDLGLQWVGILKLIHEDVPVTGTQFATHVVMISDEIAGTLQQIVKVEYRGGPFERGVVTKNFG